jgi:hypothetical protein
MSNRKSLEKYFSLGDGMYACGSGLLVLGLFCVWMGRAFSFYLLISGIVMALLGLVLFFVGSIGRVGQEDIDKAVADRLWNFDRELIEDPFIGKRMSQHLMPVSITGYDYEGIGLKSRRGRDKAWRTSQYTAVKILFLRDALAFIRRTVSVLDDDSGACETEKAEYRYSDLSSAEILRDRVTLHDMKRSFEVNRARLRITASDGSTALLVQVNDDIESDRLAENINKLIKNGSAE